MAEIAFFETLLLLVLGASVLYVIAKRLGIRPAIPLLLGGAGLGFFSRFPSLKVEP